MIKIFQMKPLWMIFNTVETVDSKNESLKKNAS